MAVQHYLPQQFFDGIRTLHNTSVTTANGKIVAIGGYEKEAQKLHGKLVPGFIDIQVNGGGGLLFNEHLRVEAISRICSAHQRFGTTALLPTIITDHVSVRAQAAQVIADAIQQRIRGVLGIHFEGPHISTVKRGVHNAELIGRIGEADKAIYARNDIGVKVVTLAPECVSVADVSSLVSMGVHCAIGHSNASAEETLNCIQAGATGFTHLYNAMSGLTGRNPGVVGAALLDRDTYAGIIADGVHVADINLRLSVKTKGVDRLILVSDAMPPFGADGESFQLYGQPVTRQGVTLRDIHGALAGSVVDLCSAIKHMIKATHVPWQDAVRMATLNPAQFLGVQDRKGHLRVGADADMTLVSDDWTCHKTWIAGELVHSKDRQ